MKTCPKCKETQDLSEFGKDSRAKSGYNCYCRSCLRLKSKQRREAQVGISRKCHLKRRYGLSLEDYDQMVAQQDGLCAICKTKPARLVVDHCHETGSVRKLLCDPCNLGLGKFFDNTAYLQNAIQYINDHKI